MKKRYLIEKHVKKVLSAECQYLEMCFLILFNKKKSTAINEAALSSHNLNFKDYQRCKNHFLFRLIEALLVGHH